jgi:ClpP class serine protease
MAGSGRLQALEQARRDRSDLTQTAKTWLPVDIAAHLLAAALDPAGNLALSFDSAAWATRARYAERDIIAAADDPTIKAVKVRVHPPGGQPSNRRASGDE